ncbi:MAG: hypothetical protein WBW32_09470 [Luteibacter sp.]
MHWLTEGDLCYHYGEYTAEGGWEAGDTNRWIKNLKKKPTAKNEELYYKTQAYAYWAGLIRPLLPADKLANVTLVPMPGSKPLGHPEFDPRMLRVLESFAQNDPRIDIRPVLRQTVERPGQHEGGGRLSPDEIGEMLDIEQGQLGNGPLRAVVFLVDDVITMGASFKAAQAKLMTVPNVRQVRGIFLARTVWKSPFDDEDF